jgi:hypothetical protein
MYRCEATSVGGFVQQLAVSYLANGYWHYVTGSIPERYDLRVVDRGIIDRYGIDVSRWKRWRARQAGEAAVHYLRHGRFYVILATDGHHPFFQREAGIRDARRVSIKFSGYAVSYRPGGRTRDGKPDPNWHARVTIERGKYKELLGHFLERAVRRGPEDLGQALRSLPFEPYAPVRRQYLRILRAVNKARKTAGLDPVDAGWVRLWRRPYRPFDPDRPVHASFRSRGPLENAI